MFAQVDLKCPKMSQNWQENLITVKYWVQFTVKMLFYRWIDFNFTPKGECHKIPPSKFLKDNIMNTFLQTAVQQQLLKIQQYVAIEIKLNIQAAL